MKSHSIYQVDAFTSWMFKGNPAAVVPLESWPEDWILQDIARENNLSETAFFVPSIGADFEIRWFTPGKEVDLCGHATLAAAHVLYHHFGLKKQKIHFKTRFAGDLFVRHEGGLYTLDFPSRPPVKTKQVSAFALEGLKGPAPAEMLETPRDYILVYDDEQTVRDFDPDFGIIGKSDKWVVVTAPGKTCDFVSRYFLGNSGINEDPVTGSTHCYLVPYWAARLGKDELSAEQVSPRGGQLKCKLNGARVEISGHAITYLEGRIFIPDEGVKLRA